MNPEYPPQWKAARVEDIADRVAMGPFGSSIKVETFVDDGIPVISGQHLQGFKVDDNVGYNFITEEHADRLKNANVQRGDVIFTHAGSIGQVALVPNDAIYARYVISQRQFYLRCDPEKALPEYIVAHFKSPQGQHALLANSSQVGVPSIARPVTYMRSILISLPPLSEQRAIAKVLSALNDKIEQNRRTVRALERLARTIFRAWFVDFEPVKAKAAGATGFPSMPEPIFDALPTRFTDSEIGAVPEGWELGRLGDVVEIHDARRIPLSRRQREERPGPYPYYGAAGIVDYVDEFLFDGAFVLVGEDGTVFSDGDRPMVQYVWGQFWVNNHAHVLTGARGYTTEHLRVLLDHVNIRPFVTGAVQPKLNQGNLKSVPIILASDPVVEGFGGAIAPAFHLLRRIEDESLKLAEARDYLLPKLLSGDVRVAASHGQGEEPA